MAERKKALERLKWWLVGVFGKVLVDLICRSLKTDIIGFEGVREIMASRKFIFAFWHSRITHISYLFQGWGAAIMVSPSDDGEIIARILQRQGHETIRGSSSRHGLRAMARLIKALKADARPGCVVPDGPQGPRFKVQPGIVILAQKTGYPIIPVSYSASRLKIFASWDRFILPYPFSHSTLIYGEPVHVPRKLDQKEHEDCQKRLEDELNRITQQVDRRYGHTIR